MHKLASYVWVQADKFTQAHAMSLGSIKLVTCP